MLHVYATLKQKNVRLLVAFFRHVHSETNIEWPGILYIPLRK